MKTVFLILSILSFNNLLKSQNVGIKFETELTWDQVKAKALTENKYIFVDCYATWCAPCKFMDQHIYNVKQVGDYFNTHFISVKVQMDRTSRDSDQVKKWYNDADQMGRQYKLNAYPTFLFFSPDGNAVHQLSGISKTADGFISRSSLALDTSRQYFTLLAGLESHKTDSVYLLRLLSAVGDAGDGDQGRKIIKYYLACLKSPLEKYNIGMFAFFMQTESDPSFDLFVKNAHKINEVTEQKGYSEIKLSEVIFKEELAPAFSDHSKSADWNILLAKTIKKYPGLNRDTLVSSLEEQLQKEITREINSQTANDSAMTLDDWATMEKHFIKKYPGYDSKQMVLESEVFYFGGYKLWKECSIAAISLFDQYGDRLNGIMINEITWECIFSHVSDIKILKRALVHMEKVVQMNPDDCNNIDTYANLQYKAGNTKEALVWQDNAIRVAERRNISTTEFRDHLEKMKKGEPTW